MFKEAIDVKHFQKYCQDTAELYVETYAWYPMPSSCHVILIHGAAIIKSLSIPIGLLSEQSQEARNNEVK